MSDLLLDVRGTHDKKANGRPTGTDSRFSEREWKVPHPSPNEFAPRSDGHGVSSDRAMFTTQQQVFTRSHVASLKLPPIIGTPITASSPLQPHTVLGGLQLPPIEDRRPFQTRLDQKYSSHALEYMLSGRQGLPNLTNKLHQKRNTLLGIQQTAHVVTISPVDMTEEILGHITPIEEIHALLKTVPDEHNIIHNMSVRETVTSSRESISATFVEAGIEEEDEDEGQKEALSNRIRRWFKSISKKDSSKAGRGRWLDAMKSSIDADQRSIPALFLTTNGVAAATTPTSTAEATTITSLPNTPMESNDQSDLPFKLDMPTTTKLSVKNKRITDEIRLNLILRQMRKQLEMHDLVEVMNDLHTGRPSKKTRRLVVQGYEMLRDRK